MKNRKLLLLFFGLFFAADGLLFLIKALRRSEPFNAAIGALWLIAALLVLAGWWIDRRNAARR